MPSLSPIVLRGWLEPIYLGKVNALNLKNSSLPVRTHNVMPLSKCRPSHDNWDVPTGRCSLGAFTLHVLLRHPLLRLGLVLVPPPAERRPLVHDVADAPQHALLVLVFCDVVVRAYHVELAVGHLLVEVVCYLRGVPGAGGFFFRGAWEAPTLTLVLVQSRRMYLRVFGADLVCCRRW